MKKSMMAFFTMVIFSLCFSFISLSFSQEMPEPGTVIDKSNVKKYAHLFPAEILPAFEDGFGGLINPTSIKVAKSQKEAYSPPKAFVALSEANKGKYSLDAQGDIVGGWEREGYPFPDLQISDKDFATKLMWNYYGRYLVDDLFSMIFNFTQRAGERVRRAAGEYHHLCYTGRAVVPPTPEMKNPDNLARAQLLWYLQPPANRNLMTLSLRYRDIKKPDIVYIYIPAMRRVLRGDTGQRAVPLQGTLASLDDLNLFDGRIPDFTFKLVGEQKMLVIMENKAEKTSEIDSKPIPDKLPFPAGPYSIADCYVVDIFPKEPTYPQSRKRLWFDKYSLYAYYAAIYDRAGKLWKVWTVATAPFPVPGDEPSCYSDGGWAIDIQLGMVNDNPFTHKDPSNKDFNKGGVSYDDYAPASLLTRAR